MTIACRFCGTRLYVPFLDLGHQPPSNALLNKAGLNEPEVYYPLKVYKCRNCNLIQIPEYKNAKDIFSGNYPYYSSQSPANVSHGKEFAETMVKRFNPERVTEIGSNDGYMLKSFKELGCTVLGIEANEAIASHATATGILTHYGFFPDITPSFNQDLICSINTFAHQPDLNGFVVGLKKHLAPNGVIVQEFPHVLRMLEGIQFDTIYHEHYNYFSLMFLIQLFNAFRLSVFDVEEIPNHGGSLRLYVQHIQGPYYTDKRVYDLLDLERKKGLDSIKPYREFAESVQWLRRKTMQELIKLRQKGMRIFAYGAAAKVNTFFNFCGIDTDTIELIADQSVHKQGNYLPGSCIPIVDESYIKRCRPDYILITAWNLKDEIMNQLAYIREWNGKFITVIPTWRVL